METLAVFGFVISIFGIIITLGITVINGINGTFTGGEVLGGMGIYTLFAYILVFSITVLQHIETVHL